MRSLSLAPLGLTMAFVMSIGTAAAAATCPTNRMSCGNGDVLSAARADSTECGTAEGPGGAAVYDLALGRFQVRAIGTVATGFGLLETADEFRIDGPPPGTPLSFQLTLDVEGAVFGDCDAYYTPEGTIAATLREGVSNQADGNAVMGSTCDEFQYCCGIPGFLSAPLTITVQALAGTPFTVRVRLLADVLIGIAAVRGDLHASGLPPGAQLSSCQGFGQGAPTPAHRASWGSVKARYR